MFTGEFYQTLRGDVTPALHNLFQKIGTRHLPSTFMRPASRKPMSPEFGISNISNISYVIKSIF